MRPDIFGADIAGAIFEAMGADLLPATLTRPIHGARDPANLTAGLTVYGAGDPQSASYPCRGFSDDYADGQVDGTLIMLGDRKILLLGKSLPDTVDPLPGDLIAIEGASWRVIAVKRDPAGATFECQVRR